MLSDFIEVYGTLTNVSKNISRRRSVLRSHCPNKNVFSDCVQLWQMQNKEHISNVTSHTCQFRLYTVIQGLLPSGRDINITFKTKC